MYSLAIHKNPKPKHNVHTNYNMHIYTTIVELKQEQDVGMMKLQK
jgi:hypothetical protein